ncbi:MAG: CPBP family intramembrane metalloprotease [Bacteroidetes bacterium]|nr:CPBP family intramembrane metalloprotease [Bacteroidota bacterium]
MTESHSIMLNKTGIVSESLWYFLGGALALYAAVHYGIPSLYEQYGVRPLVGWWLASGVIVFALFLAALLSARRESGAKSVKQILVALNIRSLSRVDMYWALGGLTAVIALTWIVVATSDRFLSVNLLSQDSYASFLHMEKLKPEEYWLFLAWLPYFFFNIVGEEFLWRGYLLPRQASVLGRYAWLLNGFLWAVFHIGIGWRIAILLLPIEFVVPYVVQRRKNTWLGIIIHGVYNGSGFVMVALGVVA